MAHHPAIWDGSSARSGDSRSTSTQTTNDEEMSPRELARFKLQRGSFESRVDAMRRVGSPGFDINRFPWQSRIVVDALFDVALERRVSVEMCVSLPPTIFYGEDFRRSTLALLKGMIKLRIIFANPIGTKEAEQWYSWHRKFPSQLSVLAMTEYDPEVHHYCLVGDFAYRFEFCHPRWEGAVTRFEPLRPARFSFNDKDMGKRLKKYASVLARYADILVPSPNEA